MKHILLLALTWLLWGTEAVAAIAGSTPVFTYQHGISYLEPLKYPPDFKHFDYVNPEAPKGGLIPFPELGTFDSFNNMINKGRIPSGVSFLGVHNLLYDRLLEQAIDETNACYGRLVGGVWVADDFSQIAFRLREEARWHDGKPVTAADVVFTFDIYMKDGAASIRTALLEIDHVRAVGDHEVVFTVKAGSRGNATLPFTIGSFPSCPNTIGRIETGPKPQ